MIVSGMSTLSGGRPEPCVEEHLGPIATSSHDQTCKARDPHFLVRGKLRCVLEQRLEPKAYFD